MTQQLASAATAVVVPVESDAGASLAPPAPSLREQIDAAMAQLLGVSAKFKDLTGQDRQVSTREETIAMMHHYMDRLEMTQRVRESLSVIHVAGTKGKGSTCAMTERILREAGYKTGLFTSPHLISPCERVRINGKPVAESTFLTHFYQVWHGLEKTAHLSGEFPPMAWFFRFLTLLALHIFLAEDVDVVILEVGIGGRLDATNVIEKPVVCGITTLDLDHTRILGETLDLIAYAKAGIFKPHVPAFTTAQEPLAMATLHECARETHTLLREAPVLDKIGPHGKSYVLGMQGDYQRVNAGLAVALATTWLQHKRRGSGDDGSVAESIDFTQPLDETVQRGLALAFWPARSHVVEDPSHETTFYIDGAHTVRSLEVCAHWFHQATTAQKLPSVGSKKALFFTIHYERNVVSIIAPLLELPFDRVYFCPTGASRPSLAKMNTFSEALVAAGREEIVAMYTSEELAVLDAVPEGKLQWQTTLARLWHALKRHRGHGHGDAAATVAESESKDIYVLPSVVDCITHLRSSFPTTEKDEWSVLATGSLYLAGEALDFLQWRE